MCENPDPPPVRRMVVGFVFDDVLERVVLLCKKRPVWQAGTYNGPGGKIEDDEHPAQAMRREFQEETGLDLTEKEWKQFARLEGQGWSVCVFCATISNDLLGDIRSSTNEQVGVFRIVEALALPALPNFAWLLLMARDVLENDYGPSFAHVRYTHS